MANKRLQRRRNYMFEKDPHCFYCGIRLVHPRNCTDRHTPQPDNMATIDHLRDRFDPKRGMETGGVATVLACRKCNNERS